MERLLGELLEELDKRFPEAISVGQLIQDGFKEKIILESLKKGLLDVPHNMQELRHRDLVDNNVPVMLNDRGFMLLNQIRTKKATDELNHNVKELNKSIKQFDKSSGIYSTWMIILTIAITALTIVMVVKLFV